MLKPIFSKRILLLLTPMFLLSCQTKVNKVFTIDQLQPDKLKYKFVTVKTYSADASKIPQFIAADLDNDGKSEMIEINNNELTKHGSPSFLQLNRFFRETVVRRNFSGIITFAGITDYDYEGRKEIIISELLNDTVYVHILVYQDGEIKKLHRFIATSKPDHQYFPEYEWFCGVIFNGLVDADEDGYEDLIFSIYTTHAYQPRGVFVYSLHKRKELWSHEGGYQVNHVQLFDINKDGVKDIVFGTNSPGNSNGIKVNGTDDNRSYLIALDKRTGKVVYDIKGLGPKGSSVKPFLQDLNEDGIPEAFITMCTFTQNGMSNYLRFFNHETHKLINNRHSREGEISNDVEFIDGDSDGDLDMVFGWSDGLLEICDYDPDKRNIDQIRSLTISDMKYLEIFVDDFIPAEGIEILCFGTLGGALISLLFSSDLEPLASYPNGRISGRNIIYHPEPGSDPLIIFSEGDSVVLIEIQRNNPISVLLENLGLYGLLFSLITIALLLGMAVFIWKEKQINIKLQQAALNSHGMPAFLANSSGDIIKYNQHLLDVVDIPGPARQQTMAFVFLGQDWDELKSWMLRMLKQSTISVQEEFSVQIDNEPKEFLVSIFNFYTSKINRGLKLVTIQDVTDFVRSKRAVAWASMAQRLAHEIKTPLATLMLSAQRLETECDNTPENNQVMQKYIKRILGQVDRLRKMTDATLKFARVEEPLFEYVCLNSLTEKWLKNNSSRISQDVEIITVFSESLLKISIDKQQIKIVLQNLLDNCLNAILGKGVVIISTRAVQSLHSDKASFFDDSIQIEISDTGRGIAPDELKDLFKPFYSSSPGGTGLGLVICKKIVEDHNGTITINSEVDVGTTVVITLPVKRNGLEKEA
ncbi:hypothetical protein KAR48_14680 [bacterium]|nr:hypothetical protein [bacterium]